MDLLNALMDEDDPASWLQSFASTALQSILCHFTSFLDFLDSQTHGQNGFSEANSRASSMLSLLDYLTNASAGPGRHSLNWLSGALLLAARLLPSEDLSARLLPSMVKCAMIQVRGCVCGDEALQRKACMACSSQFSVEIELVCSLLQLSQWQR